MLALFRKYQKGLLIVVSIVVLASFSFFGVQKAGFEKQLIEKDGDVGVAIDGSKIRLLELNRLKRFIRTDAHDTQMLLAHDMPNMLNDGVIRNDFIKSGLAKELFIAYKGDIEQEFTERVGRLKRFKPYVHKEAPFLSVEGLWEHIAPELKEAFSSFKKVPVDNFEGNIDALLTLYEYEQKLPPHMLKQFMHFQANQYKWIQPDNELVNGTFALFRAKNIGDWFGEQSIDLIAQTILNGAIVAKKAGYSVPREEAKTSLFANAKQALAAQQGGKASEKEIRQFVANQLQYLHLSESDAITLWQKVLLFKKYFQDVGKSVFVDTLTLKTYQEYLDKKVEKQIYHFREPIGLHSFREMLGLQMYIDGVTNPQARKSMHVLDLPQAMLPAEHVEKKIPELTVTEIGVKLRKVKKSDALMEIPMQDVWSLQLDESHFKFLQTQFTELAGKAFATEASRLEKLDSLDELLREKVDQATREALFANQPELIKQQLHLAEEREETLALSLGNLEEPLPGITDAKGFRDLLLSAEGSIEGFTQDGEHFYTIDVLEKGNGLKLLSYTEAKEKGILDALVTRHLEKQYYEIRNDHAVLLKDKEGNWKPFATVRDEVGKIVFKDVCRALDDYCNKPLSFEEYPRVRFAYFFDKVKSKVQEGIEPNEFLAEEAGQWQVTAEVISSVRSEPGAWYDEMAFEKEPNTWSSPFATAEGQPYIYTVLSTGVETEKLPELIEKQQEALSREAQRELILELIGEMQKADAVHFLYDKAE